MESVDKLRQVARNMSKMTEFREDCSLLCHIADAIEQEHAELLDKARSNAWNRGFDEGYSDADEALGYREDDLAEHGYIKLPVDENGETLRVGDLVDERLPFGGYAFPAPIDTMELYRNADGTSGWMVKLDAENRALVSPKLLRHSHKTVEDVLREFAEKWLDTDRCTKFEDAVVAEYAAKLQLKEG